MTATSSTSLRVTWSIVMLDHFQKFLLTYEICLKDMLENTTQNFTQKFSPFVISKHFVFEKSGLKKYNNYSVSMLVTSTGGVSNVSPWVGIRTLEDGKI